MPRARTAQPGEMLQAQGRRRMRIIESRVDWIGRECRGIVFIEFDQRLAQMLGIGLARRKGVGLKLVAARHPAAQRLQNEGEGRQHQEKEQQRIAAKPVARARRDARP